MDSNELVIMALIYRFYTQKIKVRHFNFFTNLWFLKIYDIFFSWKKRPWERTFHRSAKNCNNRSSRKRNRSRKKKYSTAGKTNSDSLVKKTKERTRSRPGLIQQCFLVFIRARVNYQLPNSSSRLCSEQLASFSIAGKRFSAAPTPRINRWWIPRQRVLGRNRE